MNTLIRRVLVVAMSVLAVLATAPAAHGQPIATSGTLASTTLERTAPGAGYFRWPTYGRLTQNFGCTGFHLNRARGSCPFFHNGIDIANARGTHVVAAASGVVRYVGWDPFDRTRNRAWVVIVRHTGGLDTWYAHLLPRRIDGANVGDRVAGGQLVGLMGSTGKSTGNHLHFMARLGGSFVNPRRFLPEGERRPPRTKPAPRIPRAEVQGPYPI